MRTIAYFIDELRLGGTPRQLTTLAETIAGGDLRPVVFCLSANSDPLAPRLRDNGVTVHVLQRGLRDKALRIWTLQKLLGRERVDLVHGWLEASNAWGWLAAAPIGLPVVLGLRSDRFAMTGVRGWLLRAIMRHATGVTVNSRAGRRFLLEGVGVAPERVWELPNWVEIPDALAVPTEPPVIAFAGRLVPLKRTDALIDAFAILRQRGVSARLEIAGDGPEEAALRRRAAESGFGDDIHMHGMIENAGAMLQRSACVVMPSAFEGLPNTALEALARGVPVVARPVGDLARLVHQGETGALIAGDSTVSIADAIERTLGDVALRARTREAGPALVRNEFSIDKALSILEPLYQRLIDRSG